MPSLGTIYPVSPISGASSRRQTALSSLSRNAFMRDLSRNAFMRDSQVAPVSRCPGLKPRWYPVYSPLCFLGSHALIAFRTAAFRKLQSVGFLPMTWDYPNVHNYLIECRNAGERIEFAVVSKAAMISNQL